MSNALSGIALCAVGLEKVTAHELERLGFETGERRSGRVRFILDGKDPARSLATANIGLRTAERVLLELGSFQAADFDQYFDGLRSLPWELCCFKDSAIAIDKVRSHNSALSAQTSLQAMGQKAAYSRLMDHYRMHTMPATGNQVTARVYLDGDSCTVGVDSSGEPLHKRGYRKRTVLAPLKETVAAGLLFLSGWNRKYPLVDPFCGSGTIAIEAALYALDFAPGLMRRFALEDMPMATHGTIAAVREDFEGKIRRDVEVNISASDIDPGALESARGNAYDAGIADWIHFDLKNAEELLPVGGKGYLIGNPPYGKRMGTEEEAAELLGRLSGMRDRFSEAGWGMGFITDREDFGEIFGMTTGSSKHIVNGAEEQWFHWFPAVAGDAEGKDSRPPRKEFHSKS
ncbi:MAG: class I SAM-dependent RNA methyltransferase [Spirochaetes bacterium]|nr:class I SAM-dependent RNA methyltransferase [Spirochaetota bacterium]